MLVQTVLCRGTASAIAIGCSCALQAELATFAIESGEFDVRDYFYRCSILVRVRASVGLKP
jgi:hypothetical protein